LDERLLRLLGLKLEGKGTPPHSPTVCFIYFAGNAASIADLAASTPDLSTLDAAIMVRTFGNYVWSIP